MMRRYLKIDSDQKEGGGVEIVCTQLEFCLSGLELFLVIMTCLLFSVRIK